MANEQSEMIKNALARAIRTAKDTSLQTAVQQLTAGDTVSISEAETQFPLSQPFVRSTW